MSHFVSKKFWGALSVLLAFVIALSSLQPAPRATAQEPIPPGHISSDWVIEQARKDAVWAAPTATTRAFDPEALTTLQKEAPYGVFMSDPGVSGEFDGEIPAPHLSIRGDAEVRLALEAQPTSMESCYLWIIDNDTLAGGTAGSWDQIQWASAPTGGFAYADWERDGGNFAFSLLEEPVWGSPTSITYSWYRFSLDAPAPGSTFGVEVLLGGQPTGLGWWQRSEEFAPNAVPTYHQVEGGNPRYNGAILRTNGVKRLGWDWFRVYKCYDGIPVATPTPTATATPTRTPSPTPTATPSPTPRPSNNAAQIARPKMMAEEYRQLLGENVRGPQPGVIELTPKDIKEVSAELVAQVKELAARERAPEPYVGLADPANGWYRFAHVADNATGSESINTRLVLGGNSGVYSITPTQPDQAMSILQWSGARGVDWAPRKIETSLVLYPTTAECTRLTIALTDRAGNILQIGSADSCTQFRWERFRMNLDPVAAGEYGVFVRTSTGDVRVDDIEGLYHDPRVGLVSYLPIPGYSGLCAPGYTQIRAPGATSGRIMADELLLEADDIVYPGNLSPVLDDVPQPGAWLCRISEEQITYAVGGMGEYRVDFATVVAGVGTLAIPRGLITGTTLVAGTAGTTTTGLIPIGTLVGVGGGVILAAGAVTYGFAVWDSYHALADTLALAEITTAWMDSDDNSGPYMLSLRFQAPVQTVYLKEGTFDSRPSGLVEKYLLNDHGGLSAWDVLGQTAPGAQGPYGYQQALGILVARTVEIPEALPGTHERAGHAAIHHDGDVASAKRGGIWVTTNNQCLTRPETCRCWQRITDKAIFMLADGAKIIYDTGGMKRSIGILFVRVRDIVVGLNEDHISTAFAEVRFRPDGSPIIPDNGGNGWQSISCPNIWGSGGDWPHDSSGLVPG
jgi:hypothetical protein